MRDIVETGFGKDKTKPNTFAKLRKLAEIGLIFKKQDSAHKKTSFYPNLPALRNLQQLAEIFPGGRDQQAQICHDTLRILSKPVASRLLDHLMTQGVCTVMQLSRAPTLAGQSWEKLNRTVWEMCRAGILVKTEDNQVRRAPEFPYGKLMKRVLKLVELLRKRK